MTTTRWDATRLNSDNEEHLWELFHENSKTSRFYNYPPTAFVHSRMVHMLESLVYDGYPLIELPDQPAPLDVPLGETLTARVTARGLEPVPLSLAQVATILYYAYGVTRTNEGTGFPRPFRTVPSGGALYPLEIYFHTSHVAELEPGFYHYNPTENNLRLLRAGDASPQIADTLAQRNLALDCSLMIFITALFERATFKYGDRGYRFILLEGGHVAQNVNLVATALGLGCNNIGGYHDAQIDEMLGLDGVNHSTIYMVAVGKDLVGTQPAGAIV
jgi:SagB-type dehydrogenase family enzyme